MQKYKAKNLSYHQARLNTTIFENFGIKGDIDLNRLISPPDENFYRCRVVYGKRVQKIEYLPYILKKINSFMVLEADINYHYKSINRDDINHLLKQKKDCDDILIIKNGKLQDTSIANIALSIDGIWLTPQNPLLEGTMRAKLLNEKKIFRKDLMIDDLKKMKKFAIMNAMVGFLELEDKVKFSFGI